MGALASAQQGAKKFYFFEGGGALSAPFVRKDEDECDHGRYLLDYIYTLVSSYQLLAGWREGFYHHPVFGTGAGTATFWLSGTGTVMRSGSGTRFGPRSNIICNIKVKN
jgi:hypothetical protein